MKGYIRIRFSRTKDTPEDKREFWEFIQRIHSYCDQNDTRVETFIKKANFETKYSHWEQCGRIVGTSFVQDEYGDWIKPLTFEIETDRNTNFIFIWWLKLFIEKNSQESRIKLAYLFADDEHMRFLTENPEVFGTKPIYRVFEPMCYVSDMDTYELYDELADPIVRVYGLPQPESLQTAIELFRSYHLCAEDEERYQVYPYQEPKD